MVQTGPALALIVLTILSMALIYFATITYVSGILGEEDDHEGNTNSGGPAA